MSSHAGGNCMRHPARLLEMPFETGLCCGRRLPEGHHGVAGGLAGPMLLLFPEPFLKSVGGPGRSRCPTQGSRMRISEFSLFLSFKSIVLFQSETSGVGVSFVVPSVSQEGGGVCVFAEGGQEGKNGHFCCSEDFV